MGGGGLVQRNGRRMISDEMMVDKKFGIQGTVVTALSSNVDDYVGHEVQGGLMVKPLKFAIRPWHASIEQPRELVDYFPLRTPYEYLVGATDGSSTVPQSKTGMDFYNIPYEMQAKVTKARVLQTVDSGDDAAFAKINWAKHRFLFTNYGRHPVQVFAQWLIGPVDTEWDPVDGQLSTSGTYSLQNISSTDKADQYPNIESFIVPGTLDNGDAGAKVYWDANVNFNQLFGPDYSDPDPSEENELDIDEGPWLKINGEFLTGPNAGAVSAPFFSTDPGENNAIGSVNDPFTARLKFFVKLLEPHGKLYKSDSGVDHVSGESRSTLDSDALNVEVQSSYDMTVAFTGDERLRGPSGARARNSNST